MCFSGDRKNEISNWENTSTDRFTVDNCKRLSYLPFLIKKMITLIFALVWGSWMLLWFFVNSSLKKSRIATKLSVP